MAPLDLVNLSELMRRTQGRPEVAVGLIDGPVDVGHADFARSEIQELPGAIKAACQRSETSACIHGTFVAGVLFARRESVAPAICPGCTSIIRPIFAEGTVSSGDAPSANPEELARAIVETVEAGARVINLSSGIPRRSVPGEDKLNSALDFAARRGALVVAAAGNQASVGGSCITQHPWVIPVVGCDARGAPSPSSNLSASIGRRGLRAPGENITSLGPQGKPLSFSGTSVACPFVTGAIALLWSEYPALPAAHIKLALTNQRGRNTIVPPVMNGWDAYNRLRGSPSARRVA